jgi:hypothetical protein
MRKGILLFMLLVVLTGCKTKYVAVPEYHNVYVEKHDTLVHRDSIFEKDSVLIMMNGDTVTIYKTKILYKDRWRERIVYRDSIRTDSIRVPYPVEKELTFWQKTWIKAGKMLFYGLVIICIIFWLVYVLRARRKC